MSHTRQLVVLSNLVLVRDILGLVLNILELEEREPSKFELVREQSILVVVGLVPSNLELVPEELSNLELLLEVLCNLELVLEELSNLELVQEEPRSLMLIDMILLFEFLLFGSRLFVDIVELKNK